jgi:hypothetical protein
MYTRYLEETGENRSVAKPPLLTEEEYARLLEETGENWDVVIHAVEIVLTSKSKCWIYPDVMNLPPMTEAQAIQFVKLSGRKDYYRIYLLFVTKWDQEKINQAENQNIKISHAQNELAVKHGVDHLTPKKLGSFFPETKEDEAKIAAYEKEYQELEAQRIDVPDYQTENYSVFVSDNKLGSESVWSEEYDVFLVLEKIFPKLY